MANFDDMVTALNPDLWYQLNDPYGSTTAADSSGNEYDGAVNGTVTFGEPGGIIPIPADTSALFDGSTGYVSTSFYPGSSHTFSAMVLLNLDGSFPANPNAVFSTGTSAGNTYGFYLEGVSSGGVQAPRFAAGNGAATVGFTGPKPIPAYGWHMLVGTFDNSYLRLYLDGQLQGQTPLSGPVPFPSTKHMFVGAGNNGSNVPNSFFPGRLSDAAFFPQTLTPLEISQLWIASQHSGWLDLPGILNVLAGTTDLDAPLAANIWAGWPQSNGYLDLLGALNYKAGITQKSGWLGLNLVCNVLLQQSGLYNYRLDGIIDAALALNILAGTVAVGGTI